MLVCIRHGEYPGAALAGRLECLDPVTVFAAKGEWEHPRRQSLVPPTPERILAVRLPFSRCFCVSKWASFPYILVAL